MSSLVLDNVTKVYPNGKTAVNNVSLEIKSQELMVLIGPSGCGKTTILRMVAGLEEITAGNIYIDKTKINNLSPRQRNVAMVFQNYALYPHMSVYDNLAFALKMHRVSKNIIKEKIMQTALMLGISDILMHKPRFLSGGQQQRVALGRAIIRNPKVFLFDEPLSNLDAHMRAKMRTELSRLHTKLATTTLFVTHDQLAAMSIGEKIAVMHHGKIIQTGDPLSIYNTPVNKFVAGFFGNPPINFFEGEITAEGNTHYFVSDSGLKLIIPEDKIYILSHYKGKKVTVGIRPENISLKSSRHNPKSESTVTSFVEVVEPVGSETLVYFSSGKHDFVSRFESHSQFSVGQKIDILFHMDKSLFFDHHTGQSII